ncbi:hypothetical protein DMN91_001936 [Ooceraea biroi]|uniref:C2H2-type domain-containing protein n=1 Tax=Ooceraea biroi TaxID=2015173 RepID=A0A026WBZ4_OOCBI|nr:uncharacterized protein LOC105281754 [Ooceraea biroi]EZA52579.1 hypothetical protein X777_08062 [Ooceraea biroi]RLU25777.1 hypothetical protein DMN91_001936 [Ooceraea biroi]
MAYTSLSKFIPIDTSNMCPINMAKPTLSEVLQSDPVKRLFNQPNLIIKTIPLKLSTEANKNLFGNGKNGMNITLLNNIKQPEISIVPVRITDEEREDANLLPSKIEDKKSEIALIPIRKKVCGHYEPCENIICDVIVQQYVDQNGASPMLATNIDEEEINAPVAKHCKNERCDALSIDHNRCRRATIKLHRCDKSRTCDICGTTLKGWRYVYRIYHKSCRRKDEYRHNNVDRLHLLRERMRERELQILEIAKTKRNDYSDPVRAMEILRQNDELIIIPKTIPSQPSIIITSVSTQSIGSNPPVNAQPVDANNSRGSNFTKIESAPIPSRSNAMSDSALRPEESKAQPISQMRFPNLQQNSYVTCTPTTAVTTAPAAVVSSQNQYIHLIAPSQITTSTMTTTTTISTTTTTITTSTTATTAQSLTINNWVVSPSHVLTTTPIQPKSFLTPIRVLPITNLITAPSLLHRTQGIPKFCIMTNNLLKPVAISNPPPQQPVVAAATTVPNTNVAQQRVIIKVPIQHNPQKRQMPKKTPKKKSFFCVYCSKHFSTDWYFKMHVARHEEKPFSCCFCDKSFSNKLAMKKHVTIQHTGQNFACGKCDYVGKSLISFDSHVKTHATSCSDEENKMKKLKQENETNCTTNDDKVCINGETVQHDAESLESARVKENADKKLSAINGNNSQKTNGFSFVSVKMDPENFEKEAVIISR